MRAPISASSLSAFVRDSTDRDTPLLGNGSQFLGLLTDRAVLGFPPAPFRSASVTTDTVRRVVNAYGVAYVVFFRGLFDANDPANAHLEFFADMMVGAPEWLEPVVHRPAIQIYRVR